MATNKCQLGWCVLLSAGGTKHLTDTCDRWGVSVCVTSPASLRSAAGPRSLIRSRAFPGQVPGADLIKCLPAWKGTTCGSGARCVRLGCRIIPGFPHCLSLRLCPQGLSEGIPTWYSGCHQSSWSQGLPRPSQNSSARRQASWGTQCWIGNARPHCSRFGRQCANISEFYVIQETIAYPPNLQNSGSFASLVENRNLSGFGQTVDLEAWGESDVAVNFHPSSRRPLLHPNSDPQDHPAGLLPLALSHDLKEKMTP